MAKITRNWEAIQATIANASSISGCVINAGRPIVGLLMPEVWTAACVTFDVAACEGGTFYELYSDGNQVVRMNGAACRAMAPCLILDKLASWWAFRIRSGCGAASPTDQGAARVFTAFLQG